MAIVLASAPGLSTGVWLIAGVGSMPDGMAKARAFAVWNSITT